MVLAIGFFTPPSFAAAIFYITHHIIVKSSLFLIGGTAICLNRTDNLDRMGNLWSRTPWLGVLFLCQALSLAGLPPLSGFWGKYLILVVGLELGQYPLVIAAILASILTLVSMLKIWNAAFWNESTAVPVHLHDPRWVRMASVVAALTLISLTIGFFAEPFLRVAHIAAERVLDQTGYVNVVFQHQGKGAILPPP
jgi:multicomponent Na+:H+ antiporter subunit D